MNDEPQLLDPDRSGVTNLDVDWFARGKCFCEPAKSKFQQVEILLRV